MRSFNSTTQRYVVQVPDGSFKSIKAEHLSPVTGSAAVSPAGAGAPPAPRLTVCNAYPAHALLQVFAIPENVSGKHHYTNLVHDLEYQSCAPFRDLPYKQGTLAFVVGRLQVAHMPINATHVDERRGLEITVFRSNVNSLKAQLRKSMVQLQDTHAYYLHVVNAYVGARLLELHIQRGKIGQKISLDKAYRLTKEQDVSLTLTDGFQRLQVGFQPRRGRNYFVVMTGVDAGLRGEPRNVGIIASEIGVWKSSEEMMGQGIVSSPEAGSSPEAARAKPQLGLVSAKTEVSAQEEDGDESGTQVWRTSLTAWVSNLMSFLRPS